MILKQGKNVPQGPESATNLSAFISAILTPPLQVLCCECADLLQRCNKNQQSLPHID
jgi:hypothetical protein